MDRLSAQYPAKATATDKIRQAILATAMADALGGPTEFHRRFTFSLVTTMLPNENFSLPPGVWTDDTSMTLCLARSLSTFTPAPPSTPGTSEKGGFDEKDQLEAYFAWYASGTLSAVDHCFDIGATIRRALHIYAQSNRDIRLAMQQVQAQLSANACSGNGSLMRVLPIGLVYWKDETLARKLARKSSMTTHPNEMCLEACEVWTQAIAQIMRASTSMERSSYTKLDLIKTFAEFPYRNAKLRHALTFPVGTPPLPSGREEQEDHFYIHHPIMSLIAKTHKARVPMMIPAVKDLPSSGYVLHSLVAALYCFLATKTFEEGAIAAINLGDDADTVGAIYGGIAGAWYAGGDDGTNGIWTDRVKEWRSKLARRELVETVAEELADFSTRIGSG
ncbi:hypothetical protein DXG01_008389 [Tephrocybe rancida]|nr:hypothetical protein DXG01_008389 [Tephrocybe rancida]